MKRIVISTFSVVGFHAWGSAPKEVSYLASQHRHTFHFRVEVGVDHSDRDVEYHMLKRQCLALMDATFDVTDNCEYLFDGRSCEMIAEELGKALKKAGVVGLHAIEVWEDQECGSRVEWP